MPKGPGSRPEPGNRKLSLRLAAGSFTILALLLPVLVAFVHIGEPPAEGEAERVRAAIPLDGGVIETPLAFFYGLTMPDDAHERWATASAAVVSEARFGGMLALLAVSGLLYILVAMVRGRTVAVLTCLTLCLAPSFSVEGYILRPSQAGTMFGLLGVLLLHFYPLAIRRRTSQRPWQRWLNMLAIVICVSLCFGVSVTYQPHSGIYMLVPGGALMLVGLCVLAVFPRVLRRRGLDRWPYKAASMRFVPWILMCMGNLFLVFVVLIVAPGEADESVTTAGLFPETWYLRALAMSLAFVGAARMLLAVGLRLGRQGHLQMSTLLLVYVAAILMQHATGGVNDHLPAAPALAILMGDGALVLLFFLAGRLFAAPRRSE